jgi:8-amino-7-oxononanoate synthase
MKSLDHELTGRLDRIREQNLYRALRRVDSCQGRQIEADGRTLLNFSSNDYLGLANEPMVKEAAIRAVDRFGAGAGASRSICGSLAPHHELEDAMAAFKGTEAALGFSAGYAAALGAISALVGKGDVIIVDKLVHASIVDAARLSRAKLRVFAHNDLNALERILQWSSALKTQPRVLIVTESLFSMDGDRAPLRELVELKDRFGAWLMVDEAHATGLFGTSGRGLVDDQGLSGRVEVQMVTLGKALGSSGGCICGSRRLIEFLVNRARTFVFSTAPAPAAAAAATAAIRFVQSQAGQKRRELLWTRIGELREHCEARGTGVPGPIIPVVLGDSARAVNAARNLLERGLFIPAIRYPTVARGAARLRITLTSNHSADDITRLNSALSEILNHAS